MRQYKCIITLSQSASCSYHICSFHIYWFWWVVACSLGGNSEYDIFPQELVLCNFPTSIFSSWKKGRYLTTGKEWVKFRTSLILHDIEEFIQLSYIYLPAHVLESWLFQLYCHISVSMSVRFLVNKLWNWSLRYCHK